MIVLLGMGCSLVILVGVAGRVFVVEEVVEVAGPGAAGGLGQALAVLGCMSSSKVSVTGATAAATSVSASLRAARAVMA